MTRFRLLLGRTVTSMDIPFGYSLTIWASGTIAIARFGFPSLLDSLLFLTGAIAAYVISAAAANRQRQQLPFVHGRAITLINVSAVVAAGLVSVVASVFSDPMLGYLAAGFIGTIVYVVSMTLLMLLADVLYPESNDGGPAKPG